VLSTLDGRGILNSIASRNDPEAAQNSLAGFGISKFFLYPEIGWNAKSSSIARISKNLNIGFEAILFIDDQPFERAEGSSVHADVWCSDSSRDREILDHARLKPEYVTSDARLRRQMYLEDMTRSRDEEKFSGPKEEFLRGLRLHLQVKEAQEANLPRAEELTFRTNQLNATGRTYTVETLMRLIEDGSSKVLMCELNDRFGTYGTIGLAVIRRSPGVWTLELLLFSCRVMSRGIGTVFLSYLREAAREAGVRLLAEFRHTGKNRAMFITYKFAGFKERCKKDDSTILLENDLTKVQPIPDHLHFHTTVDWSK